jgi:hypothetical protein
MSATTATTRLQYEGQVRLRQGVIAALAGVLLVISGVMEFVGPHTSVSEITLGLITESKRSGIDIASAVLQSLAWFGTAWTFSFLFGSVKARDPRAQGYIGYLGIAGAPLIAVGAIGYSIEYASKAHNFINHGAQTYPQADHLLTATSLDVLNLLELCGVLLVTIAFVLVSMQAMRAGLLTRFMGYLGIIAGVLVLFGAGILPIPVVQAYWLVALGVLLIGRWPTGTPPAWDTGNAEKWPSSAELREQRMKKSGASGRERGRAMPKPEPKPVASEADGARAPRTQTPKRKRKRRR